MVNECVSIEDRGEAESGCNRCHFRQTKTVRSRLKVLRGAQCLFEDPDYCEG